MPGTAAWLQISIKLNEMGNSSMSVRQNWSKKNWGTKNKPAKIIASNVNYTNAIADHRPIIRSNP